MLDLFAAARACGFEWIAPLRADSLEFRQEVRDMCQSGHCGSYGKSWCCPPACPPLEEMRQTVPRFPRGILVQTVAQLEDDFDYEGMVAAEARHKANFDRLVTRLRGVFGAAALLPMGAGGCRRCERCTYPDAPCRFPNRQIISMEAYGLLVSQVCDACGLAYYHGAGTLAYVSCILLHASVWDEEERKETKQRE